VNAAITGPATHEPARARTRPHTHARVRARALRNIFTVGALCVRACVCPARMCVCPMPASRARCGILAQGGLQQGGCVRLVLLAREEHVVGCKQKGHVRSEGPAGAGAEYLVHRLCTMQHSTPTPTQMSTQRQAGAAHVRETPRSAHHVIDRRDRQPVIWTGIGGSRAQRRRASHLLKRLGRAHGCDKLRLLAYALHLAPWTRSSSPRALEARHAQHTPRAALPHTCARQALHARPARASVATSSSRRMRERTSSENVAIGSGLPVISTQHDPS
jgi:hypothetical protein